MALSDQENLPAPPSSIARRDALAIVAVVLLAAAVRLFRLGEQSFWVDEINVLSFVRSGHLLTALRARGGPFELPLHYVAVWAASFLPLDFETSARLPAAVFGTLEVLALMLVARRLTARIDVTLLAGLLLAVAPFAIRYSQENRYYTTFSALALLTWWLVLRAIDRRTTGAFLWWGVGVGALVLAHPFAPLVVVAQLVTIVVVERRATAATGRGATDGLAEGFRRAVARGRRRRTLDRLGTVPLDSRCRGRSELPAQRRVVGTGPTRRGPPEARRPVAARQRRSLDAAVGAARRSLSSRSSRRGSPPARGRLGCGSTSSAFLLALVPLARALNTYLAMRRIEFLVPELVLLAAIGIVGIGDRIAGCVVTGRRWWRRVLPWRSCSCCRPS